MGITVYRAIFGEDDGSHQLLKAPSDVRAPFTELLRHTDRPKILTVDSSFSGPALRGLPLEGFYALIKIFPDPGASRRGMVRAYALLTPIEEAIHVDSLAPFFTLLPDELSSGADASSFSTTIDLREEIGEDIEETGAEYGALAQHVLAAARQEKPVIWIGADELEDVASVLWHGLWPAIREKFAFRHAIGPQDLSPMDWAANGIRLVASPRDREGRWGNLTTTGSENDHEQLSLAEFYLLGLPEGNPLREFENRLEVNLQSIHDLILLHKCFQYFDRLESLDAGGAIALAKITGHLSPNPQKGKEIKVQILRRFEKTLSQGEAEDIMRLRNFNPQPFDGGKSTVASLLRQWVKSRVLSPSEPEIADILPECFSPDPSTTWKEAVLDGLSEALSEWPVHAGRLVWNWWRRSPELVLQIANLLPDQEDVESDLVSKAPENAPQAVAEAVQQFACERQWPMLYATAGTFLFTTTEAFRSTVHATEFDDVEDERYMQALRVIADRSDHKSVLEAALDICDNDIYKLAGEICADDPELLAGLEVDSAPWRAVWLASINVGGHEIWTGVPALQAKVQGLLESVVETEFVDEDLLLEISTSPYADLTELPSRSEVWGNLPPQPRENFLQRTAEGWVDRFLSNPGFEGEPEKPLRDKILEESRLSQLLFVQENGGISRGVQVFETFQGLPQKRFRNWLKMEVFSIYNINKLDAETIGQLIRRRRWHQAASDVYRRANSRSDLRPALHECKNLLSPLDTVLGAFRGIFAPSSIGPDDWWRALTEVVIQLYPEGVEMDTVWIRAGGDLSAINLNQPGRNQWEEALRKLRHGGTSGDISIDRFLEVVSEDYPGNQRIRLLAEKRQKVFG